MCFSVKPRDVARLISATKKSVPNGSHVSGNVTCNMGNSLAVRASLTRYNCLRSIEVELGQLCA